MSFYKTKNKTKVKAYKLGLKDTRKIFRTSQYTKAITLPSKLKIGKVATLAADRLILIDPRGEIPEDKLLEFLERFVEPNFWVWLESLRS